MLQSNEKTWTQISWLRTSHGGCSGNFLIKMGMCICQFQFWICRWEFYLLKYIERFDSCEDTHLKVVWGLSRIVNPTLSAYISVTNTIPSMKSFHLSQAECLLSLKQHETTKISAENRWSYFIFKNTNIQIGAKNGTSKYRYVETMY